MRRRWFPEALPEAALHALPVAGAVLVATVVVGLFAGKHFVPTPEGVGARANATLESKQADLARQDASRGVEGDEDGSTEPVREPTALTPALRARGYNACYMPDPGFGGYSKWQNIALGQMIVPLRGGHTEDGGYDVIVHFHGHEAVRHAFVEVARGAVLVGIDLGASSGPYEHAFADPNRFAGILRSINRGLQKASGDQRAHIRHLALSSWSAGYGAVSRILAHYGSVIDALVLLDSLHSSYAVGRVYDEPLHHVFTLPLAPSALMAERAARGDAIMFLSHSEIVPPGYASTTEVADYLLGEVSGVRAPMYGTTPLGAQLKSGFDKRGLHVRGYGGGDKAAHCMHVELLAEAVRDYLEPAWGTPAAERPF